MAYEPDVVFAVHPAHGIVAAVSDGLPSAEAVLLNGGFTYHAQLDIFSLPAEADPRAIVPLIHDLQTVGYAVAADPQLLTLLDGPRSRAMSAQTNRALAATADSPSASVAIPPAVRGSTAPHFPSRTPSAPPTRNR
jgi:hypothetical protein